MKKLAYLFILGLLVAQCAKNDNVILSAEGLDANIDKKICVEGIIVHICGVNGNKMKLMLADSTMVMVVPEQQIDSFSRQQWKQKQLRICGMLHGTKLTKQYLDSMYNAQQLLCSIDYKQCTDTAWVSYQWREGNAEKILASGLIKQEKLMNKLGLNYIPLFTLTAESIKTIDAAK